MPAALHPVSDPTRVSRYLTTTLAVLMPLEFAIWHLTRYHLKTAVLISIAGLLPWIVMARGLWRGIRSTYVTSTLWIAPYLAYGVMEMLANPRDRTFAIGLVVLSMASFLAITQYLRLSRATPRAPN